MTSRSATEQQAWTALESVMDPEVPVLSVVDLGIVRGVDAASDGSAVTVDLTPTYSGCPAILAIEEAVADALREQFAEVTVHTVLSPPWTTDWISDRGRAALREAGIAPPPPTRPAPAMRTSLALVDAAPATDPNIPHCPRCDSGDVERISQFGATACTSLWRCRSCLEPFEHFKAL